jgi:hypothetical protein
MPELPNLLRQRLAETQTGAVSPAHPDANTITAYVEQSLSPAERQTLVAHLSVCGPCRDVVALSQPNVSELVTQTIIRPAPVSAWRRFFTPGFGLAASAAAIAVIAVLVLQLPQRTAQAPLKEVQQPTANTLAGRGASLEVKETAPGRLAESKSAPAMEADQLKSVKGVQSRQRREEAAGFRFAGNPPPPPSAVASVPVLAASTALVQNRDYVNTNFFSASTSEGAVLDQQGNNIPSAPQPQAVPTSRAFSTSADKITVFSDIPPPTNAKSNLRILTPNSPPDRLGCPLCKVATAAVHSLHLRATAPAIRAGALGTSALGGPGMFSTTLEKGQSAEFSAVPEKADGGSLARSEALSGGALASSSVRSLDASPTLWKIAGGKLIRFSGQSQWEDAYPASSGAFEFSCVNARGSDVWAGGTHSFLVHSRDGGSTWETVKMGDAATGTIINIVAGSLNVQVKTSDNQNWLSSDGGKTWTMRDK